MLEEDLNVALISAIHAYSPKCCSPAVALMDALHIGREAAYRRLRGEVLLSFEEAFLISQKLRFSLDQIANTAVNENVLFRPRLSFESRPPIEQYICTLKRDTDIVRASIVDPTTYYAYAGNSIPPEIYLRFPQLAMFKYFKWIYQHDLCETEQLTFEDLVPPADLSEAYHDFTVATRQIPMSYYVFDDTVFSLWINNIRSFRDMHLISSESVAILKDQLAAMIDDMKQVSTTGGYSNGGTVQIYLSDINLGQSCCYMKSGVHKSARLALFAMNDLRTTNEQMCDYVHAWIQTQGRFATLISRCGESYRLNYFKRQRENLCQLDG